MIATSEERRFGVFDDAELGYLSRVVNLRHLREEIKEERQARYTERKAKEVKCPDHPDAEVFIANMPARNRAALVCIICGKKLGEGPRVPAIEEVT